MDISLIMPLRLRGGYATECHAFSYFSSSSAFAFSPPCGSCSVFEVAHTVNKYALNKYSFGCGCPTIVIPRERSDRGNQAVRRTHQADNLAKLRQEFLPLLKLIAKIFCAVEIERTSEALGNMPLRFAFLFRGFPRLRSE